MGTTSKKTVSTTASAGQCPLFEKPLPPVVLASKSPRRLELLAMMGMKPNVVPADLNEVVFHQTFNDARALATALSQAKCRAVARTETNAIIIAADTVVAIDGTIMGQPKDSADATAMLTRLQGQTHQVVSSISVFYKGRMLTDCQTTDVTMQALDDDAIARYVATGEPMDKAGAYAIQGMAGAFVEKIDGCYFNVVGLSLNSLAQLLKHLLG